MTSHDFEPGFAVRPRRAGALHPPFPQDWEAQIDIGARRFRLRPMRPGDVALYPAYLARITAEDMRLRFLSPTKTIPPDLLLRLTQFDHDRDMAFIALDDSGDLAGIVRYSSDPDHRTAEFGELVRSDLQGLGLGIALMRQLVDHARAGGIERLYGLILRENRRMQAICCELGFTLGPVPDELTLVRASLVL